MANFKLALAPILEGLLLVKNMQSLYIDPTYNTIVD